jgi:hypothetical protein
LRCRNFVIAPNALADWGCDAEYLTKALTQARRLPYLPNGACQHNASD